MNKNLKRLVSVTFAAMVLLAGCSFSKTESSDFEPVLALRSNPKSMDNTKFADLYSSEIVASSFEGLYNTDGEKLQPAAAKSYEVSEDGKTYTFKLREDGKWFDSTGKVVGDVTAKDFEYGWKRLVDPKNKAEYSYMFNGIVKNAEEINAKDMSPDELGIMAVDDYTLKVELAEPAPYFLEMTTHASLYPVNEDAVKEFGDDYGMKAETTYSNGAYHVSKYDVDKEVKLAKNKEYWDADNVSADKVTYQIMPDAAPQLSAYKNGEIDLAYISTSTGYQEVMGDKTLKEESHSKLQTQTSYFTLNVEKPTTANKNFRLAVLYGFNNEEYVNEVVGKGDGVANAFVPTGLTAAAYDGNDYREAAGEKLFEYDLEKAKSYAELAKVELGVSELKVTATLFEAEQNKILGEKLQSDLAEVGITVELNFLPSAAFWDETMGGNFELAFYGWSADFGDPSNYLYSLLSSKAIGSTNFSRVSSPDMDAKLIAANKVNNTDERFAAYAAIEKEVIDNAYYVPISQSKLTYLVSPKIEKKMSSLGFVPLKYLVVK